MNFFLIYRTGSFNRTEKYEHMSQTSSPSDGKVLKIIVFLKFGVTLQNEICDMIFKVFLITR